LWPSTQMDPEARMKPPIVSVRSNSRLVLARECAR
jgi:hypothetical protein